MIYNNYESFKNNARKELNDFPKFFAFNEKQFEEGKKELNIKSDNELCKIWGGGFIRKTDRQDFINMIDRHDIELKESIKADTEGDKFIYSMFLYEMNNHEYSYTYEVEDTLEALCLTWEEVQNNNSLLNGFKKAKNFVLYNE